MLDLAQTAAPTAPVRSRGIRHRTAGQAHGPVTRLFSPGDLGRQIKPFVFLDRIDMQATDAALFGYHPHSGIITVTTVFEGDTAYEDSTGAAGVLVANGVEWMQAGGGVWHTANPAAPGRVRGYQLWLALPEALENAPAASVYLAPGEVSRVGPARVILGQYDGVDSPLPSVSPLTYLHVTLKAGEAWTFVPPSGHDVAWAAVEDGGVHVSGTTLRNEVAVFAQGDQAITFEAKDDVTLMVGSAMQHPHPLVTGHYSVHTSREALAIGEAGIETVGLRVRAEGKI